MYFVFKVLLWLHQDSFILSESWIITGEYETGVSAIIKDALIQYQRLEFHKLKPKPDEANRSEVQYVEESNTPKLRLVRVGNSKKTSTVNDLVIHIHRIDIFYPIYQSAESDNR